MSEYWVSKKRYFCKYCDVYIADDAPSRQHHENGLRHKGNVDRFVRGLYKEGVKRKKDADEEKREMQRIEQAANAAFAQDVGAGRAQYKAPTLASSPAVASSSQKPKKSGGISDYSTPESLGYTDPDIERARAEAERRRTQGVAGDWQVVENASAEGASRKGEESTQHDDHTHSTEDDLETNKKRAVPDTADEDEGRWKLRKKTTAVGLGEIYDPGIIVIRPKVKPEIKEETGDIKATAVPKWAPVKWKKAGEGADDPSVAASPGSREDTEEGRKAPSDSSNADENPVPDPVVDIHVKEDPLPVKLEEATTPSIESASSGASLFRKRKAPTGGGASSRGRRF
ncbi:hypothetical protein BC827DRAFT_1128701 [Russula dissimulans]|nr:hypothetical protein BC827DRAFT_1128701 [Russula dissimulans]